MDVLLTCPLDCPDACRLKVTLEERVLRRHYEGS